MSEKNNGGPAYPYVIVTKSDGTTGAPIQHEVSVGMTLRDYFAGQALVGVVSNPRDYSEVKDAISAASFSYEVSDAMLEARK